MSIILASASPRRKELLKTICDDFKVVVSDVDESLPDGISIKEIPCFLATKKAEAVAKEYPQDVVIGSDTVVILNDNILGKPKDRNDAFEMLSHLSGNIHSVITGCCIRKGEKTLTFSNETAVEFYELSNEQINAYIDTNEPFDKAGAYGIQGKGSLFVKGINGDYFNVVGLPISMLNIKLKEFESFD